MSSRSAARAITFASIVVFAAERKLPSTSPALRGSALSQALDLDAAAYRGAPRQPSVDHDSGDPGRRPCLGMDSQNADTPLFKIKRNADARVGSDPCDYAQRGQLILGGSRLTFEQVKKREAGPLWPSCMGVRMVRISPIVSSHVGAS